MHPTTTGPPCWIGRTAIGVLLGGAAYASTVIGLALTQGPALPPPVNLFATTAFATAVAGLIVARCSAVVVARIEQAESRIERRLDSIGNGMVEHGIQLEAVTGEIPRVRPIVTACPHTGTELDGYSAGYADGLARRPMPAEPPPRVTQLHRN